MSYQRLENPKAPQLKKNSPMTGKQKNILKLIVLGKSNVEIGEHLGITSGTVKQQITLLLRKYDCNSRVDLAFYYVLNVNPNILKLHPLNATNKVMLASSTKLKSI